MSGGEKQKTTNPIINSSRSSERSCISADESESIPRAVDGLCWAAAAAGASAAESAKVSASAPESSMKSENRVGLASGSCFGARFPLPSRWWLKDSNGM